MCSSSKVSVIVPTHEKRDLWDLKWHLQFTTTYKNTELIIVNEGLERSQQRNIGVERSSGEYLLFLDSDMIPHHSLIENCVDLCNVRKVDALYIPEIIVGHPVKTWFRQFYNGSKVDAIRFVRKSCFVPFDENLTGVEDWDWDRRTLCEKGMAYYPIYHRTKGNLGRKLFYYSKWIKAYKQKHPDCPALSPVYRLKLILGGIWKKIF